MLNQVQHKLLKTLQNLVRFFYLNQLEIIIFGMKAYSE